MDHPVHSGRSAVRCSPAPFGPRTLTLLCGCAAANTAAFLGAEWLSASLLGVPMGLWLVGASVLTADVAARSSAGWSLWAPGEGGRHRPEWLTWPALRSSVIEWLGVPAWGAERASRAVVEAARSLSGTGSLRIELGVPRPEARVLRAALEGHGGAGVGGLEVCWLGGDDGVRRVSGSDVRLTRDGDGVLVMATDGEQRRPHGGAAERGESGTAPTYPELFPAAGVGLTIVRTGPLRLEGCELSDPGHARLLAELLCAAAACARAERLSVHSGDRLARALGGRTPYEFVRHELNRPVWPARPGQARGGAVPATPARQAREAALLRLAATFKELTEHGHLLDRRPSGFVERVARVISGFLATWDVSGTDGPRTASLRLALMAPAAEALSDDPAGLLRLAAVQIGAGDDEAGCATLAHAARVIRVRGLAAGHDAMPYLLGELSVAGTGRLSLGRVAAGLALTWGVAPVESLAYVREDLEEELRAGPDMERRQAERGLLTGLLELLERGGAGGAAYRAAA